MTLMWHHRLTLLHLCTTLLLALPLSVDAKESIHIGVLAFNDRIEVQQRWQPTLDYLNQKLPSYHFQLEAVQPKQMDALMEQGAIDFMINNAVRTVQYKERYGVSQLLTVRPNSGRTPERAIGSSLIVSSDLQLGSTQQLGQMRVVSASKKGFGGYMAFQREVVDGGDSPEQLFGSLQFVGFPQNSLFDRLRSGEADVAILPSCHLELSVANGVVNPGEFKVALAQPYADFPCAVSSRLYPYFMLSKLNHVDSVVATAVAKQLLELTPESVAAKTGRYNSWTMPVDDSEVYGLLKSIQLWPFAPDWQVLAKRLAPYGLLLLVVLVLGYLHHYRVKLLVARRTTELRDEVLQHNQTQAHLVEQQNAFYKAQRVLLTGEMASGLSHELSQPLASIRYLTQGCQYRMASAQFDKEQLQLGLQRINAQTEKAQGIIQRFRGFCARPSTVNHINMRQQIEEALVLMEADVKRHQCRVQFNNQCADDVMIKGDAVLLQQVLVNLLRNGIDAMDENAAADKVVTVTLSSQACWLVVQVSDRGCGLSEAALERLFMPFETSKAQGLGLGMMICKRIIEQHQGQISAANLYPGLKIEFRLPKEEQ
ncbi:sensor histidine kinase [Ferrimonas lipolytica]|uniref:histidine kinase n=1 Tax=Ferrimonas lipolytica TaxID=2724191 RepID=A0A6H1UD22_9GAMM|nr:ATP-binding protein [Ferrimonas lipolytica]QIZ76971.1 PhnD/SsuA/transferrin family substrate-binding protein [Ferrimonas lipolytica]